MKYEEFIKKPQNWGLPEAEIRRKYNMLKEQELFEMLGVPSHTGTSMSGAFGFPVPMSPNAQLLAFKSGIYGVQECTALTTLEVGIKAANLWDKLTCIYPFVGASALGHQWNLKDVSDSNNARRITWYGPVIHDPWGIRAGSYGGYGDMNLVIKNDIGVNNFHMALYFKGAQFPDGSYYGTEVPMGNRSDVSPMRCNFFIRDWDGGTYFSSNTAGESSAGNILTSPDGFFVMNRRTSTLVNIWQSGTKKYESNAIPTGGLNQESSFILTASRSGGPYFTTGGGIRLATVGQGLTDQENTDLYNISQTVQAILGRQL
jgi:hypothetical protein